ncbi:uncharacterized protein MELLADRAFT_61534 [Melampsora larici-populina 98AG31]|uniref:Uncharacterized protein n=1 Tax=Melampsora larici-populina (strain 98AG31 / pathotype 3-4-7) TaxID=747676 RepID=F4RFA7_MELLP|nr:uncharacterized protein MELLADRAFT_61534 [Melampsora larici-populina 98AG31]EGG08780.1 hypothetical protein MELLADRAFT_61534 [Melampsora larici-populina 98AG31]
MSYLFASSPLMFGINIWQVVKSTITRTQAKLKHTFRSHTNHLIPIIFQSAEKKTVPCSMHISSKSNPVVETSCICASSYQVRNLRCELLAAPSAFDQCLPDIIDEAGCKEFPKTQSPSNEEKESSSIDNLLALDSLCKSTSSSETNEEVNSEPIEVHKPEPSSFKPNCAPSSFLAFLEASHLEMSERLRSQQSPSTTLDLGCAQFNSAYYRRHPPPSLPKLKLNQPSKKPFCWKSKLDQIMRESGEECDETVEESSTAFDRELTGSSSSNSRHSRSSSILSDRTCVESPELVISSVKTLEPKPFSSTLIHPDTLPQPIVDAKPILATPSTVSACTPSSFLAFLESSNLKMITRMQAEKSKQSNMDLGCVQFNSVYYRRNPPPSLPRLKEVKSLKKPFCWRTTLDEMMKDEECEDITSEMVDDTKPQVFSHSSPVTPIPRARSSSCSSIATCVEATPTSMCSKHVVSSNSSLDLSLSLSS